MSDIFWSISLIVDAVVSGILYVVYAHTFLILGIVAIVIAAFVYDKRDSKQKKKRDDS